MTEPLGQMIVAGIARTGEGAGLRGFAPAEGRELDPVFTSSSLADLDQACAAADEAALVLRALTPAARAGLLEAIASHIEADGDSIIARAILESGLPQMRIEGELGRTCNQLRLFARVLRDGGYLDVRIDPAIPDRAPPRPDLRLTHIPLGPVAVFGASNFPLAFSVAGGDTASALAAGCPVIVKAHPAHPGTSELVGCAVAAAVAACGLPGGVFSLLFEAGHELGAALVADRRITAVGFTGSRRGGLALMNIAASRPVPIPVYAEMSAINPVLVLPGALAAQGEAIGKAFAGALTLGSGQFCTNPGLVLALADSDIEGFVAATSEALTGIPAVPMLTPGIHDAYCRRVAALSELPGVARLAQGPEARGYSGQSALFGTSGKAFLAQTAMSEEVFGASSLLVRCADETELAAVIAALEGQLTFAVHAEGEADLALAARLMPVIERKAGRILFGGFGTGVEVCDAMVHGGPFPSTSDGRSTSVGSLAIMRFLRPVCYQDVPAALLPPEAAPDNPLGVPRRIDGVRG